MKIAVSIVTFSLFFSLTSCSSGNDDEAIRKTSYYENSAEYWSTFSMQWKSDVCDVISGPDDKEGLEKAIKIMKMMLKVNVGIDDIDISVEDGYSKALRVFLAEKCVG